MNVHQLEAKPGRTVKTGGKECLFFSGYDYLGINNTPEFIELVKEGVDRYGWVFPSSRISNTQLSLYQSFEDTLSRITNSEATVCFSSGFAAGNAAIALYDEVFNSPVSHPAIQKGPALSTSYEEWSSQFVELVNTHIYKTPFVLATDAVDPLTATVNDLSFLNDVSKPVTAIIDDSHGIGLIGKKGSGISAVVPRNDNLEYIFTYSLSKAFGLNGGALNCTSLMAEKYRKLAAYTASTSMSPALMYAFIHAQDLYATQRQKLQENIACFAQLVNTNAVQYNAALPMFILPPNIDEAKLFAQNIIISSFAYPDPSGNKIQRLVVNALHTKEDLEYAASVINEQVEKVM